MAKVAVNALGCEQGVESHYNILFFSCSRIGHSPVNHRQHGDLRPHLSIILRNFLYKWMIRLVFTA
jgi:hypothetical protein